MYTKEVGMEFKGQNLEVGDFIAFRAKTVPLPEVHAAVIDVKDGVLEVMSTLLAAIQHSGKFPEDEVGDIRVVYPAEVAIPQECRGKGFQRHQKVSVNCRDGEVREGEVIAAFDGIVVARQANGLLITGGASYFRAVEG